MDFTSLGSLSLTKLKFCACDQGVTDCSYKHFADCETISRGKEYDCLLHSSHSRRKRHAMYLTSFSPDPIEHDLPIVSMMLNTLEYLFSSKLNRK